jgi:putative oxidoreductase
MIPERFRSLLLAAQPWVADLTALAARLTLGQAFVLTGLGKLRNLDRTTTFFAGLGIPAPAFHAAFVGGVELLGGALLILGLGVRASAFALLGTMAVAILTADRAGFLGALALKPDSGLTDVVPWMFALILLPLLAHGGGLVALDRLICRRCTAIAPDAR